MEALVEGRADATTVCGDRRRHSPSQFGCPEANPESYPADPVAYLIAFGSIMKEPVVSASQDIVTPNMCQNTCMKVRLSA